MRACEQRGTSRSHRRGAGVRRSRRRRCWPCARSAARVARSSSAQAIAALDHPSIDVRREAAFAVAHIGSGDRSDARGGARCAAAAADSRAGSVRHGQPRRVHRTSAVPELSPASTVRQRELRGGVGTADAGPARAVVSVGVGRGAEAMARRVRTLAGTGSDSPRLVALLESLLDRHAPPARGDGRRAGCARSAGPAPRHQRPDDAARADSAARRVAAAGDADAQVRRLAVLDLASRPDVVGRGRRGRVRGRVRARAACGRRRGSGRACRRARKSRSSDRACGRPAGRPRRAGRGSCVPLRLRQPRSSPRRRAATLARARARARRARHVPMPRPRAPTSLAPRRPTSGRCACMRRGPRASTRQADVLARSRPTTTSTCGTRR